MLLLLAASVVVTKVVSAHAGHARFSTTLGFSSPAGQQLLPGLRMPDNVKLKVMQTAPQNR